MDYCSQKYNRGSSETLRFLSEDPKKETAWKKYQRNFWPTDDLSGSLTDGVHGEQSVCVISELLREGDTCGVDAGGEALFDARVSEDQRQQQHPLGYGQFKGRSCRFVNE